MILIGHSFKIPSFQKRKDVSSGENPCQDKELMQKSQRLYILTLGCLPTRRNLGIGSRMMQHIIQKVSDSDKRNQIGSIFLHVQINNEEAIHFYKKFGFAVVKEVENYYPRLTPSNAFILEKHLLKE